MFEFFITRLLGRRPKPRSWDWSIPEMNESIAWLYRQVPRSENFSGSLVLNTRTGRYGDVVSMECYADETRGIQILWDGQEQPTYYGEWDEALSDIKPLSHP